MLLSLFKLAMIVSLLIGAVCIETKDSPVKDKAGVESPERRNAVLKEESIDNHEDFLVQKRQSSKHNRYSNDQDPRSRRCSAERRTSRAGVKDLANKMAKDALKSPKMQETMNKLSRVASKPHGTLIATVKVPVPRKSGVKKSRSEQKHDRHKGRRKSKSKRHHRRYKNGHGWKGGSSKRTSDSGRDINSLTKDLSRKEKSLIKCNQAVPDKSPATPKSNVKITHVEDSDYIDFSSPVNTESLVSSKLPENESPVKLHDDERMIDKLMRTTTRDPLKKSPGDQGIEYSDYYSDNDVLEDLAANKIPMQIARSRNSNDRFARETANFTSHRRVDRHVPPQHRNHVARRKNFKYPGKAAKRSFHGYPTRRFVGSNRFLRTDDSRSKDDQYEHLDPMYSVNTDENQQPKQEDPDVFQNEDTSDDDGSNDVQQQNPEQFNYLTQYEVPQEGDFGSMNEAAVPQESMDFPQDENSQLPERFDSPDMQNIENYQPGDTSLQVENFDQNFMNQPRIENVDPSMENINGGYEVQSPSYPVQSYGNLEETQDVGKDVSMQSTNNLPHSNSAMDQPLGKILKSLGINIDADSGDKNQNANLENGNSEKMKVPVLYPDSLERPEEHAPSYLKHGAKAEINRNEVIEKNRAMQSRNGMVGHSRRHSLQNDNQFLPYTDSPAHHMNISIAVQDTKEIATQILDTIMEELEELKLDRSKNNKREGSWSTAQAGVKLDMRVANRTIIVTVSELATPRFHESLLNGTWNVSGHAPFKRGSPFTLIATDNNTKSIAVFVGACRVCQGVDTIAGVWSVARQPKDCRDFQVATSVFNDIFRKTKLSSLRENHNSTGSENGALNHEKRKS
ncbi:uncharacterized protein LOC100881778 isoform X2 [Megachile rotundata]|uniref:uncharacterized protein LOC100881778 isoform X2 n=1 Tax=Megachile rotundata TaxID=143995 RepID=UPI003FD6878B